MYARHFGLQTEAFALTPDPAFLYRSPEHAEALAALEVGLRARRGLMVMSGEVGTGKTTLLYTLLTRLGPDIRTAYVSNTKLPFDDILRQALDDFGVAGSSRDRLEQLQALNGFLHGCAHEGATAALVIDEAQNLDVEGFENLRLLSNFETFTDKLLQIVLVGQPELEAHLKSPSLRQVAERVAVHCHINPLSRAESRKYIEHRLRCAGGSLSLFTPGALRLVVRRARGIPRRLNIICDNALLFAYGDGAGRVGRAHARAAARAREGRGLVTIGPPPRPATAATRVQLRRWLVGASAAATLLGAAVVNWKAPQQDALGTPAPVAPAPAPQAVMVPAPVAPEPAAQALSAPLPGEPVAFASEQPSAHPAAAPPTGAGTGVEPDRHVAADSETLPDAAPAAMRDRSRSVASSDTVALVRVAPGATLASITREVYGVASADLLSRVQHANPQIVDPNRILAGDTLRFPDVSPNEPR